MGSLQKSLSFLWGPGSSITFTMARWSVNFILFLFEFAGYQCLVFQWPYPPNNTRSYRQQMAQISWSPMCCVPLMGFKNINNSGPWTLRSVLLSVQILAWIIWELCYHKQKATSSIMYHRWHTKEVMVDIWGRHEPIVSSGTILLFTFLNWILKLLMDLLK